MFRLLSRLFVQQQIMQDTTISFVR